MRDALGDVQSVLVFGGGSDIALATVRRLVGRRSRTVVLAAHHPDMLDDARAVERVGVVGRAHHRAGPATDEAPQGRERDVGASAEDEDGLDVAEGVTHARAFLGCRWEVGQRSPRRRARSDCSTPVGSTRSRTRRKSPRCGYISGTRAGSRRESLAR